MASGQTSNYGLNQWAAEDPVLREDFNQDNAKIDAALEATPKFAVGSYAGNGSADAREIIVGFRPSLVYICTTGYWFDSAGYTYGGLITEEYPLRRDHNTGPVLAELSDQGFVLFSGTGQRVNYKDTKYIYYAVTG